jgi:RNA polymerase sigma-70 factor (ECF subfamily)
MRSTTIPSPAEAAKDHEPPDADGNLYARSRVVLRPALAGRLGSPDDAEDVLHEAFIRFLNAYSGRTIANPLALLGRIAMNIVRDLGRSERLHRTRIEAQGGDVCRGPQPHDPETICADQQGLRKAQEAIDRLPPRCREVFLLHRLDGLSHAEVARVLGISRSMVEKHLARADRQVRGELAALVDTGSAGGA